LKRPHYKVPKKETSLEGKLDFPKGMSKRPFPSQANESNDELSKMSFRKLPLMGEQND